MHLSILSNLDTAYDRPASGAIRPSARAHREGLLRGLVFLAAMALPLTLAIATGHAGQHDPSSGYGQSFDPSR